MGCFLLLLFSSDTQKPDTPFLIFCDGDKCWLWEIEVVLTAKSKVKSKGPGYEFGVFTDISSRSVCESSIVKVAPVTPTAENRIVREIPSSVSTGFFLPTFAPLLFFVWLLVLTSK